MAQLQNHLADLASKAVENINVETVKDHAGAAGQAIGAKAVELRDAAAATKDDITDKLTELDRMLEQSITEYNDAYTLMNDEGLQLYLERMRSDDLIALVENLVNSIANHPKSFDSDFGETNTHRKQFSDSLEFASRELQAARMAAGGAGAGLAAGASVAFMAPTAAMWVATTFGTASTGTAISALSGAAATNAALAWLGGGALAAGGGGMAAGEAFLALAGPIGWTIAGASLLSSIVLFSSKRSKLNKQKNEEIESVKRNTQKVKEMYDKVGVLHEQTRECREGLDKLYRESLSCYGQDYVRLDDGQKARLGSMVNITLSLSKLFEDTVG